ncbi:MAG: heme ABC exporter ATP-binding protein CcmA [Deltaproteobacteria bacterium]|nr:heme ABC exporter ATP-binding protein CcmA [Deltaproteobacteria bacterium]
MSAPCPALAPVELVGVGRLFGPVAALAAIDLHLEAAALTLVVGPNGAGKSTLLRLLAGLLRPSTGTVRYAGRPAERLGDARRAGRAFLAHRTQLYGDLTVRENLALAAALRQLPPAALEPWLERFDLRAAADRPARVCSRGQAQRAALARTFLGAPSLVLLDEPTAALDAAGAVVLHEVVAAAVGRGAAVVLATHEPQPFADLAGRTVALAAGRLVPDREAGGLR